MPPALADWLALALGPLEGWLTVWLCCACRFAGLFWTAPIFSSDLLTARWRLLLAAFCGLIVAPGLPPVTNFPDLWVLGGQGAVQVLLGVGIGLGIHGLVCALQAAGGLIEQQSGGGQLDHHGPLGSLTTPIGGLIAACGILTVLLIPGGEARLLNAVLHSFHTLPIGQSNSLALFTPTVLTMTAESFRLTIQLAAPVLAGMSLFTLGYGFLARTAPTLPVLSLVLPLRCVACLAIVYLSLSNLSETVTQALETILEISAGSLAPLR